MKRAAITYCFILMLCGLNFTTAQTNDSLPTPSTDSVLYLSLDSCRAMTLRNNIDIRIAQKNIEKAEAEKSAALSNYFPKISANAGAMYMFKDMQFVKDLDEYLPPFTINDGTVSPEMTTDIEKLLNMLRSELIRVWEPITVSLKGAFLANITLQQPIFAGGRIVSGNKMAKIGVEMAQENNRLQKSNALVEADKMYWLYISVKEKVKLAETYAGLLDNLVKMVSDAATTDMISNNDLMKVKVQRDKVKMELQKARSGLELTRMALCKTLGVSYDTQIVPTDTIVQTNEHFALTPPNALERRPEYQLMQKMIAIKEGEIKLVRGNYLPTIGMAASYAYVGGVKVQGKKTHPQNLSNVMATISIPITNWWEGSQKIKSARVDKNIAELEVEKNLKLIELEIKQAELNMTDAFTRINMCDEALEQTKENLRIMTDRYELDLETLPALLEAQAQWQNAYSELIDARIDFRIKETEYLKAIGELTGYPQ